MTKTTFFPPDDAIAQIVALLDDADEMSALTEISRYIAENCGLPHIDPIDLMDSDPVKVFLIWYRLAGRDWFPHHVGEIEDIIEADDTELGRWLDKENRS